MFCFCLFFGGFFPGFTHFWIICYFTEKSLAKNNFFSYSLWRKWLLGLAVVCWEFWVHLQACLLYLLLFLTTLHYLVPYLSIYLHLCLLAAYLLLSSCLQDSLSVCQYSFSITGMYTFFILFTNLRYFSVWFVHKSGSLIDCSFYSFFFFHAWCNAAQCSF